MPLTEQAKASIFSSIVLSVAKRIPLPQETPAELEKLRREEAEQAAHHNASNVRFFRDLPAELRNHIYELTLGQDKILQHGHILPVQSAGIPLYRLHKLPGLIQTSKQARTEAMPYLVKQNRLVSGWFDKKADFASMLQPLLPNCLRLFPRPLMRQLQEVDINIIIQLESCKYSFGNGWTKKHRGEIHFMKRGNKTTMWSKIDSCANKKCYDGMDKAITKYRSHLESLIRVKHMANGKEKEEGIKSVVLEEGNRWLMEYRDLCNRQRFALE